MVTSFTNNTLAPPFLSWNGESPEFYAAFFRAAGAFLISNSFKM